MTRRHVDIARPPFRHLPSQTPHDAAEDIVAAFGAVANLPDKVQWVWREATAADANDAAADAAADDAIRAAGDALSAAIDADGDHFDRHAYHNRQHFCEVMLAVCFLCRVHRLAAGDARLLLLAALAHDIVYEGRPKHAFEFERSSVERATPFLVAAGVTLDDRARLATLILATEPNEGVRTALRAGRFHLHGAPMPPLVSAAPELAALAADIDLSRLALVLCEADLLPSVGLTAPHGMQLQDRLSEEWSRPLAAADKLRFIDGVLRQGVIGPFFRPNAVALRHALLDSIDEPARV